MADRCGSGWDGACHSSVSATGTPTATIRASRTGHTALLSERATAVASARAAARRERAGAQRWCAIASPTANETASMSSSNHASVGGGSAAPTRKCCAVGARSVRAVAVPARRSAGRGSVDGGEDGLQDGGARGEEHNGGQQHDQVRRAVDVLVGAAQRGADKERCRVGHWPRKRQRRVGEEELEQHREQQQAGGGGHLPHADAEQHEEAHLQRHELHPLIHS